MNLSNLSKDTARPTVLHALFARHRFVPHKRLGQHFLVSPEVADRIVSLADLHSGDQVLEIGAGAGALTLRLVSSASLTVALEVDPRLLKMLGEIVPDTPQLRILQTDVLTLNFVKLLAEGEWKIVGNLPYSITGPTLGRLLENKALFSRAVVMVQEEVGARILSPPGRKDYGRLSVMLQAYFIPRKEMTVGRGCFHPKPEVDSTVLSLVPRPAPLLEKEEEKCLAKLVHAAFLHRRKTLENSLAAAGLLESRQEAEGLLEEAGIGLGRRAESLAVEEFAHLASQATGRFAWAKKLKEAAGGG